MQNNLHKKKILILAASSDIGVSVVEKFLDNDWYVVAHYNQNTKKLFKFKNQKKIQFFKLDLSKPINIEKTKKIKKYLTDVSSFVSLTGYLNLNNYDNFKISEFFKHININYLNNQIFIRYLLKSMIKKKWGRILVSSSVGTKFGGGENSYLYSLSKFMNEFFPKIFKNLAKQNIFYNSIQIGLTNTKLNSVDKNKDLKKRVSQVPIQRMAKPEEIAEHIYNLASDKNTYITLHKSIIAGGE